MRLICPNCDAEYEVDDAAIPDTGRDVQCSNCGHAWFQTKVAPDTSLPVNEPVHADEPAEAPETAEAVEAAEAAEVEEETPPADMPQPRGADEAVLAILKEEADRELAARRAEAVPVETQPELGIDAGDAAAAAQAKVGQIEATAGDEESASERVKQLTRRELLPNIEEINSTLRPSSAVRHDDDHDEPMMLPTPRRRSGFRSGFALMLIVAAVMVAVYLMAPRLSQQIPGAKGALDSYVAGVDQARIGLDSATKSVIGALQRFAGSE
jgi:predicted Zn finger-like uncharacterized protein